MDFSNEVKTTVENFVKVRLPRNIAEKLNTALSFYQSEGYQHFPASVSQKLVNGGMLDLVLALRTGIATELEKLDDG